MKAAQLCLFVATWTIQSTLEWVAYPFSSRSSRPSNQTGVSCIAGGFFTNWAIREALLYMYAIYLFSHYNFSVNAPWKCILHWHYSSETWDFRAACYVHVMKELYSSRVRHTLCAQFWFIQSSRLHIQHHDFFLVHLNLQTHKATFDIILFQRV